MKRWVGAAGLEAAAWLSRSLPVERFRWRIEAAAVHLGRRYPPLRKTLRVVRLRAGGWLQIDVADHIGFHVFARGVWEPHTTQAIVALLRPGATFVDVGANIGYFTVIAGHRVGAGGRVAAFEPIPELHATLERNIALNRLPWCQARREAAWNVHGSVALRRPHGGNAGTASVRGAGESDVTVPAVPVDAMSLPRVDLVKIDVEGAEAQVLEGMSSIIRNDRPDLIIEMSEGFLAEMGRCTTDIFASLSDLGYRMYLLKWGEAPRAVTPVTPGLPAQYEALFTPRALPPVLTSPMRHQLERPRRA